MSGFHCVLFWILVSLMGAAVVLAAHNMQITDLQARITALEAKAVTQPAK